MERASLIAALTRYPLPVDGSEGYKKAEVTGGGLPLEQINCATMESRVGLWTVVVPAVDLLGARRDGPHIHWPAFSPSPQLTCQV